MNAPKKNSNVLTLIVPSYNEASVLPKLLPDLIAYCEDKKWKIILVNDGSTDETSSILNNYPNTDNFKVIHHRLNRGYGAAIKSGISEADTKYIVTIDSDGQHYLEETNKLLAFVQKNDADMVVGCREKIKSASKFRGLGKWIIRSTARILVPLPIHDLNSGMKLYRTALAMKYISLYPDSMAFSDIITLVFVNQKHLVLEVPIRIRERQGGTSTIGVQTAFQTFMELINIVTLFNPLKIFLPISIFFITTGLAWGIYIVSLGRGVSVGSSLSIIMGIISFLLGLLAEQLSTIRKNLCNR